ncbi:von Willebrand domain-containing protein [Phanerochaete sordida]|uniref:von Willebrand domain-containing protein n=1 Tax=Phanerochaete sordida TaxID=48140 RepID=A0A9P3GF17_9APHY|nr:von Willebrand domain-containing protein [Phanerochaete sordida]
MRLQTPPTPSTRPCGIQYSLPSTNNAYLPLVRAKVHADVVDVSAIITITQEFWQHYAPVLQRAKYIFPIPARAAVCAFKMTAANGTVIAAVAKEKERAQREHEAAISQGCMTGLVEHVTDDIFTISLGALPSDQMVTTEVTYVLDLMDEEVTDQVQLRIPMYIGMCYGTLPVGIHDALQVPPERVSISVDVRMQGTVRSITSPTHPTLILSDGGAHTSRGAWGSRDFLTSDFVLAVAADGLDAPRCFAQRARSGATALQLNIVPKFNLPGVEPQEYAFLIDQSSSMAGDRIEVAKRALVTLLRALPSRGTKINVFGFGSRCDILWHKSMPYDESSIRHATEYVDRMEANHGGTNILNALDQMLKYRETSMPTACFILTAGQAHDQNCVFDAVQSAVRTAMPSAPLRIFTLGIGHTPSAAMCEGIARAGNGISLFATSAESIIGKCSKLVRASRACILKNVSIDWGVRNDLAEAYRTGNTSLKGVRQAPADVAAIYPGSRFVVFALVEDEDFKPPREVVIRAQRDGQGEVFTFSVPVQVVAAPADARPPLIPTLAVHRTIMDLEDAARGSHCPQNIKATIVRLGREHQLASKYTSFVAVDRRGGTEDDADTVAQGAPTSVRVHATPGYSLSCSAYYGWDAAGRRCRRDRAPVYEDLSDSDSGEECAYSPPPLPVACRLFRSRSPTPIRSPRRSRSRSPTIVRSSRRSRSHRSASPTPVLPEDGVSTAAGAPVPIVSPPTELPDSPFGAASLRLEDCEWRRPYSPNTSVPHEGRRSRSRSPPTMRHRICRSPRARSPDVVHVRKAHRRSPRRSLVRCSRSPPRTPPAILPRRWRMPSRSPSPSYIGRRPSSSRSRSRSCAPRVILCERSPPRSPTRVPSSPRHHPHAPSPQTVSARAAQPVVVAPPVPIASPLPPPIIIRPPGFEPHAPLMIIAPSDDTSPQHRRAPPYASLPDRPSIQSRASPVPVTVRWYSRSRTPSPLPVRLRPRTPPPLPVRSPERPRTPPPLPVRAPSAPRTLPPLPARAETAEDRVRALARLQAADGSFAPTPALGALLAGALLDVDGDATAWATALAVALLRRDVREAPEVREGLVEKAVGYVEDVEGMDAEAAVARAQEVVEGVCRRG